VLQWYVKQFAELSVEELLGILRLRQDVFIIEQDCIYPDIDDLDQSSVHVFAKEQGGDVVACTRLVPPSLKYKEPSVGRVVVAQSHRKDGCGVELMQRSIAESERLYPGQGNRIGAQLYLNKFYRSLGYENVSDEYDEDGIPHIDMFRASSME